MAEVFYQSLNSTLAPENINNPDNMATHDVQVPAEFNSQHMGTNGDANETPDISHLTMETRYPRRLPRPGDVHSPRSSSPTGSVRSVYGSSTTRRRVSRGMSWSSSSASFHRHRSSEVSKELTAQAESEFFALTELMASMSRRSLSLREVWSKIIAERESCYAEMDRMAERFEEFTEVIERHDKEKGLHHHEHEERKQEVVKVRVELSAAVSAAAELKAKLAERDGVCRGLRDEVATVRETLSIVRKEHEETKKTSEQTRLTLVATEAARADLDDKCGRLRGEREALDLKYTELHSRHEEFVSKHESQTKELVQLKQSYKAVVSEKSECLGRIGELEDKLRKCELKYDEFRRKYHELEESYEKKTHEVKELHETVTKVRKESSETITKVRREKEELETIIIRLRRELEEEHGKWEDAEDRCGSWKLKWEHSEREITTVREEISRLEMSQTELRETVSKKTEELRLVLIEKKRIEEECGRATGRADENHRQLLLIQETLSHTESTLKRTEEEIHIKRDLVERLQQDAKHARSRIAGLEVEIQTHQSAAVSLRLEVEGLTGECGELKDKCRDWEGRYEEVCESFTEYEEGSSGFEVELSRMREMLRESREQKERAITARNSADRERDEAISRYEAKCREIERLEESMSMQMHEQQQGRRSSGKIVTRHTFTRGGHMTSSGGGGGGYGELESRDGAESPL
ncbi:hypothetical protein CMUS01_07708 [Colletotrichum musicola]|uniref:Uncharacterized protein n=1 Tax=Colletotrichum musicola TaxID=2175873 RepID=A0A8H6KFZ1_9PEZI|nr:hypothetical protein CMUS01_07708 [Colletotrichum musicola]